MQNKLYLILINERRSWNSFYSKYVSISLSMLFFLKCFPTIYENNNSDVCPERAEGPSLCLCDSCESQHDLILWQLAKLHLDSNWADFVDVWFFCPNSVWCIELVCAAYYMPENKTDKQTKVRPGLEQQNCVFFVLGQLRWIHQSWDFIYPLCYDARSHLLYT